LQFRDTMSLEPSGYTQNQHVPMPWNVDRFEDVD